MKSKDAGVKLAVEFDYIKKGNPAVNMIVSGFSQATRTIEEKIRGGFIRRWNESGRPAVPPFVYSYEPRHVEAEFPRLALIWRLS
ncbi:hypothetical protein MKFW12EY_19700 [Methylomonas koyamae]|nr:hypothetical protein MKFW12EY_19700 [Methylomonas koyamae]